MQLTISLRITNPMNSIYSIYDTIMAPISDHILDGIWAGLLAQQIERQYISAAANVAFVLAFVTVLSSDDAATVASGKRKR